MKRIYPLCGREDIVSVMEKELPHRVYLTFYGHTTCIKTNSQRLYDHISKTYQYFITGENNAQSAFVVLDEETSNTQSSLQKLFPGRSFSGSLLIACELNMIFVTSGYSNLAYELACLMFQSMVLHLSPFYFNLHAAALARDGTGILIPGSQHCGKTTLSLELIKRGFALLSDDLAIIDRKTLAVMPFPRALNIRENTLPLISDFEDRLVSRREFKIADEKRWFLDLKEFSGSSFIPQSIIFPQLTPTETPCLEPFSKTRALLELLRQAMVPYLPGLPQPDDASNFEVASRLVQQASTHTLKVGEIRETIDILLEELP
jgi:hypothetical protein